MKRGFREEFKFYKRRDVSLDLQNVENFGKLKDSRGSFEILQHEKKLNIEELWSKIGKGITIKKKVHIVECQNKSNINWERDFGMKDSSQWEVFEFLSRPGLLFIKNPFKGAGQRYWIVRCLKYYTRKPNKLNIDPHNIIEVDDDWWDFCQRNPNTTALEKLRWATFGYHHNWDTKEYSESSKSDFPSDLKILCSFIANELNFVDYKAEAAIINFYHFGCSLSGHRDHSEVNVDAPLFSFSFGQSAIFLIGGNSIEDEAIPLLLESGDVLIMSGGSRLFYHGVPRILPADEQPWNLFEDFLSDFDSKYLEKEITQNVKNNKFWEIFNLYVSKSRINMNIRQVLSPGQLSLDR